MARDLDDAPVFMAPSPFQLQYEQDRWKAIRFSDVKDYQRRDRAAEAPPAPRKLGGALSSRPRLPASRRASGLSRRGPCVSIGPRTRSNCCSSSCGRRSFFPSACSPMPAWTNYRTLTAVARERVERTLDVLQEHAQKVFQTIDRTIGETNEVLRDTTDAAIRAGEERLHLPAQADPAGGPVHRGDLGFRSEGQPPGVEHRLSGAERAEQRRQGLFQARRFPRTAAPISGT